MSAPTTPAPLRTRPLHELFGIEVEVPDRARFSAGTVAALDTLVGEAGLMLIRDARLEDEALANLAGAFGTLQNMSGGSGTAAGIFRVSNLDEAGNLRPDHDPARKRHDANKLWHTDSSFMAPGATYSFLYARIVPEEDKDTLFCDGRVAWEALDTETQDLLRPLSALHSMDHSWRLAGVTMPDLTTTPVGRKLVRRHEPSGREALVIPSHVERIEGRSYDEGQALMGRLTAVAAAPHRVYRHKWQVGDLLVWDNRCMLHRASRRSTGQQPRDLRTCRLIDVDDTGLAPLPERISPADRP